MVLAFAHCQNVSGGWNRISLVEPSRPCSEASLSSSLCTLKSHRSPWWYFWWFTFYRFHRYYSLRSISFNQFTGTIPPELGLTKLQTMYAQNCIFPFSFRSLSPISQNNRIESAHWYHPTWTRQPHSAHLFVRSESQRFLISSRDDRYQNHHQLIFTFNQYLLKFVFALSGNYPWIGSMAPSRLSLVSSLSSPLCTLRISSFHLRALMLDDPTSVWWVSIGVFSLTQCHSFRYLRGNQLTGTIPPELSTLALLQELYAQTPYQTGIKIPGKRGRSQKTKIF